MSGHSKWSTIKRQKGANDAKRGQAFTKAANAITIAVREGGGRAETNFKLRLAIEAARAVNMPKENIERAIARGTRAAGEKELLEVIYEGYGPAGVAILVESVTDNKMRTASDVRSIFERAGGTLAGPGSVAYLFKALVAIDVTGKTSDEVLVIAADAGADDVEERGEVVTVYTNPEKLEEVKRKLSATGLEIVGWDITKGSITQVEIVDDYVANSVLSLINKLEDLDVVQKVYSNFDIPTDIMEKII